MVVRWRDMGKEWGEGVEWWVVRVVEVGVDVVVDVVEWEVRRRVDEWVEVVVGGRGKKVGDGMEVGKVGWMVGMGYRGWGERMGERKG